MNGDQMARMVFVRDCVMYGVMSMIWYRNILFRCLPYAAYGASGAILWAALVGFGAVGLVAALKRGCRIWVYVKWLILAYGLYTVCAYAGTWPGIFAATAGICLAVSVGYGLRLRRRMAGRRRKYACIRRSLRAGSSIFAVGVLAVMLMLSMGRIFGDNLISASAQKVEAGDAGGMMEDNRDTLEKLREETWRGLSTMEKLDVLQTAANIQAAQLGLPNEIRVGASNLSENALGAYSDDTHTISLNLTHLENDPACDVLNTCFHEVYHSYQFRIADAYRDAAPQLKGLALFRRAAEYVWEFERYQNAEKDWALYSTQQCESDSRAYAADTTQAYLRFLEEGERE